MKTWSAPEIPQLPTAGQNPVVFCSSARGPVAVPRKRQDVRLYVCGITPYDATHLGHAATYVTFDTLIRVWRDAGISVNYVQNTTDIDDPLLERAAATGVDWQELACSQIALFFQDMEALRVIPPDSYIGAVESMDLIVEAVQGLQDKGFAYTLETGDVYYRVDSAITPPFGSVSHFDRKAMTEVFGERGGDPDTPGKENPLDALLWRAEREGEPSWDGGRLGRGRPGWHIECTAIAQRYAGLPLTVQGGGSDLVFPHHEMCAAHATALTGEPFARAYMHTGMVGLDGEKMSKSRGNLVFVSKLLEDGVDPMVIRLVLLSHHYRSDWSFHESDLAEAEQRLELWRAAAKLGSSLGAEVVVANLRQELSDDLDTPAALGVIDDWASAALSETAGAETDEIVAAVDALLGVRL
ncbi:cysteine--1-D-myo-inosityl 2-amino-2-deoxy-alpha-D-glucopyranoside ligase [Brevibacterium daeguense]|uniref:cysteine--1-D-myo-inosityl 2-amino-2-deoxy-alpha-D-glucopyranoside ligase n=1 Tax=Brevibacterium daeguense TaxID=909936 RepID=UPI001F006E27